MKKINILFLLFFSFLIQGCSSIPFQEKIQLNDFFIKKEINSDKPVVMFILDTSDSMNKNDIGEARITKAKNTIIDTVSQLDTERYNISLITFDDCRAKVTAQPTNDVDKVINITKSIDADGPTPLAHAIKLSGESLKNIKNKMIILLSDGQETCSEDPIAEAKKVHQKYGININFQIIGYDIDNRTRRELQKISEVSKKWQYYEANDHVSLKKTIDNIFTTYKLRDDSWVSSEKFIFEFDTGSTNLKKIYSSKIEKIYKYLKNNKNHIKIIGHTDSIGSKDSNDILSKKRANIVKRELIKLGINQNRITTEGKGENHPVANNETEQGRKQNRRVEISVSQN